MFIGFPTIAPSCYCRLENLRLHRNLKNAVQPARFQASARGVMGLAADGGHKV